MKLLSLLFVLALPLHLFAQPILTIPFIESYDHPKIGVQLDVKCNGSPSREFRKEHFTLYEDGKKVNNLSIDCPEATDVCCVSAAIVVDASASMRWDTVRFRAIKDAAIAFVDGLNGTCDFATIVRLGAPSSVVTPWTNNKVALQNGINTITANGASAIWDAVVTGIDQFIPDATSECRAVVLVTDGRDNSSMISLDSCITFARRRGIRVFVIQVDMVPEEMVLKKLAEGTGGRYTYAQRPYTFTEMFTNIRKLIRRHFDICQLQYNSPDCSDGFPHEVEIRLGEQVPFCGGSVSVRTNYTSPNVDHYLPPVTVSPKTILLDTSSVGYIPILMTSDVDSLEMYLNDYVFTMDSSILSFKRVITPGTLLQDVPLTTEQYYNTTTLKFSLHRVVKFPVVLCSLEVAWKKMNVQKQPFYTGSNDSRARCHYVTFSRGEVLNKQLTVIEESQPIDFSVSECYPNPLDRSSTEIVFTLTEHQHIRTQLINQLGRSLKTLTDGEYERGAHVLHIDASSLTSGMYSIVFTSGNRTITRKFVKAK